MFNMMPSKKLVFELTPEFVELDRKKRHAILKQYRAALVYKPQDIERLKMSDSLFKKLQDRFLRRRRIRNWFKGLRLTWIKRKGGLLFWPRFKRIVPRPRYVICGKKGVRVYFSHGKAYVFVPLSHLRSGKIRGWFGRVFSTALLRPRMGIKVFEAPLPAFKKQFKHLQGPNPS